MHIREPRGLMGLEAGKGGRERRDGKREKKGEISHSNSVDRGGKRNLGWTGGKI
jgi:hypothetical protein